MPSDTPVAAISAASRPHQRTVRGTLDQPPSARLPAPLTVVIGDVAGLDVTACGEGGADRRAESS
jgi:siroheme synthase